MSSLVEESVNGQPTNDLSINDQYLNDQSFNNQTLNDKSFKDQQPINDQPTKDQPVNGATISAQEQEKKTIPSWSLEGKVALVTGSGKTTRPHNFL